MQKENLGFKLPKPLVKLSREKKGLDLEQPDNISISLYRTTPPDFVDIHNFDV